MPPRLVTFELHSLSAPGVGCSTDTSLTKALRWQVTSVLAYKSVRKLTSRLTRGSNYVYSAPAMSKLDLWGYVLKSTTTIVSSCEHAYIIVNSVRYPPEEANEWQPTSGIALRN